jgi:hypothetical protein
MTGRALLAGSIAVLIAGCGGAGPAPVRFANQAPVWHVDDKRNVAASPRENPYYPQLYHFDGTIHRRLTRALSVPGNPRAANVNAVDEVPNSTWFTNRIGRYDLTPEQVAGGAAIVGSPEPHRPWTIVSSKIGGGSIGFIAVDARGERFLLKFDDKQLPEAETAADVIVQRLMWASGFHTPEDYIVHFVPGDLVLAADAYEKTVHGSKRPLDQARLAQQLALVDRNADGTFRGLASMFLKGKPLGGHARETVRKDDPNDTVPHLLRRELRGAYVLYSWLDHVDMKEDNTLDVYVTDAADTTRSYVVHYFIDFGKALGVEATTRRDKAYGNDFRNDYRALFTSLVTLGSWPRPWEGKRPVGLRGVGLFEAEHYAPGEWKASTPSYFPAYEVDRFDGFWGARLLMRFSEAHLGAVVAEARLSDPRSAEYLVKTLIARQRATGRYWFARVTPMDEFAVEGGSLCGTDLGLRYAFATAAQRWYRVAFFDRSGARTGIATTLTSRDGDRVCVDLPRDETTYRIVSFAVSGRPPVEVHLGRQPDHPWRVIGLWRR